MQQLREAEGSLASVEQVGSSTVVEAEILIEAKIRVVARAIPLLKKNLRESSLRGGCSSRESHPGTCSPITPIFLRQTLHSSLPKATVVHTVDVFVIIQERRFSSFPRSVTITAAVKIPLLRLLLLLKKVLLIVI